MTPIRTALLLLTLIAMILIGYFIGEYRECNNLNLDTRWSVTSACEVNYAEMWLPLHRYEVIMELKSWTHQ